MLSVPDHYLTWTAHIIEDTTILEALHVQLVTTEF